MKLRLYQVVHASEECGSVSSPSQETVSSFSFRVSSWECEQIAEKGFGVIRRAHHERKMFDHSSSAPFVPRLSKGGRCFFRHLLDYRRSRRAALPPRIFSWSTRPSLREVT